MATQALPYISPEQYLELDRAAERRSEYVDRQMYAMAGGTRRHARIISNLSATLAAQLAQGCEVVSSDLRVHVEKTGAFFYPDLLVACSGMEEDLRDFADNPELLIEVTSKSSETYDRGLKFSHYRAIPSLRDYLIVDQFRPLIEHYSRQNEGTGLFHEYASMNDISDLPSIGARLKVLEVYRRVNLAA